MIWKYLHIAPPPRNQQEKKKTTQRILGSIYGGISSYSEVYVFWEHTLNGGRPWTSNSLTVRIQCEPSADSGVLPPMSVVHLYPLPLSPTN